MASSTWLGACQWQSRATPTAQQAFADRCGAADKAHGFAVRREAHFPVPNRFAYKGLVGTEISGLLLA